MPSSEAEAGGASLPVCNALWVGPALGPLEAACLASFVEAGHAVDLHVYDLPANVPTGVRLVDAAETLSPDLLIRHRRTGSVSLFSNRFRYALLEAGRGLWIDCDLLCLKPIADAPYIFGREDESRINGAVLRLPAHALVLAELTAPFTEAGWIPPWVRGSKRLRHRFNYLTRRDYGLADMSWGTAGPKLLTWHLHRLGLDWLAQPQEVFYPVGPQETELFTRADMRALLERVTPQTACIHLWNKELSEAGPAAKGSFVSRIAAGTWREALGR